MGKSNIREFLGFAGRAVLVQTVSYFLFGLIMSNVFDYGTLFQQEVIRDFMRPIDSPYIFFGPLIQPIRGLLFAIGLWPLRKTIFENKHGWLILWSIFVIFGILSTPAAAPSSVEGIIYTQLPIWYHLIGLPEIMLQTLTFSVVLYWWERVRYRATSQIQTDRQGKWASDIGKAVMTASLAYIGYAVASILSAVIARVEIDMETAASDLRTQMMFVVAFVINIVLIFLASKKWVGGDIALWHVFLFFWVVDTAVILLYQLIFLSPMPLPLALFVGLFPACIIAISMRFGYRKKTRTP